MQSTNNRVLVVVHDDKVVENDRGTLGAKNNSLNHRAFRIVLYRGVFECGRAEGRNGRDVCSRESEGIRGCGRRTSHRRHAMILKSYRCAVVRLYPDPHDITDQKVMITRGGDCDYVRRNGYVADLRPILIDFRVESHALDADFVPVV